MSNYIYDNHMVAINQPAGNVYYIYLIPQKATTFWRIPILTNCGFGMVRKKKKQYISDAAWERV